MEKKTEKKEKVKKETIELAKYNELNDKFLRLQAEFVNYQNRTQKEIENMFKYEGMDFVKKLLPIIDNFERAIKLDDQDLGDEVSKFLAGFKIIYGNLNEMLRGFGVVEIDALGKEFDPQFMEAVITENDESKPSNVVLEVFTKGYMYKDKVIRPAMVKVNN